MTTCKRIVGLPKSYSDLLKLDLKSFLSVLSTYGQDIVYEQAVRCPCWNKDSGQPNFRCPVCSKYSQDSMRGWIWRIPRIMKVVEYSNQDNCIPSFTGEFVIPVRNENITQVFYAVNKTTEEIYTVTGFGNSQIQISGEIAPTQSRTYDGLGG